MKTMVLIFSCVVVCFGVLIGGSLNTHAQFVGLAPATLPDLVVANIACKAPNSNLAFTVSNLGSTLPTGWKAAADVYVGTTKVGSIDLRYPSSGSIATRLGSANYVAKTIITKSSSVKVVVDPLKTVKESNESNNSKTQTLAPCTSTSTSQPQVTLDYEVK
jgi:subtilase family serine protease